MKRYVMAVIGFAMIVALSSIVSCKGTKVEGCTGCCETAGVSMKFEDPNTLKEYNLQFYNAITPVNYKFCDFALEDSSKVDSTCRPNVDTVYNEGSAGYNDQFFITNYSASSFRMDGLRTSLKIRQVNDTTPIWQSAKRFSYGDNGAWFDGEYGYEYMGTHLIKRPLKTGPYIFTFDVYDSVDVLIFDDPLEDYTEAELQDMQLNEIDKYVRLLGEQAEAKENAEVKSTEVLLSSVESEFCIIRNDADCEISGCVGRDAGDALLK